MSDDHIALVDLYKDLLRTEEVESVTESANWQCALHFSQIVSNHFID